MDRQEGYYWVKIPHKTKHEICYYYNNYWYRINGDIALEDKDIEQINEVRIKEPGELPEF